MILPVRGSLGVAPMNVGFVYFHPNNIFANHAAINVVWNAGKSLLNSSDIQTWQFMDDNRAEELFASCYPTPRQTDVLLKEKRPNVIILILESFSNRLIEPLGGLPDATPNLNRLCGEGVLFSNIYSNSDRTDKGILGILNGYPAHPTAKVMNFAEKTRQLPYINKDLKQAGYHTGFVYGYDARYSNFASYFGNASYDRLITREDFPPETYRGAKWGVPDHWVLERLLEECNSAQAPFFKVFMGLSSHEPFEVPMPAVIHGIDEENLFLNSVYYSDRSLGDFIESARQTDWWEHTLIVITSDHGSRHPGNVSNYEPAKFHVPMLWIGGAVAKTDTVIATIAAQTDIPLTILRQLELDNSEYRFSKDILGNPVFPFAFYTFNNGFGFVAGDARFAFDNVSQTVIYREGTQADDFLETGKAYLQVFSKDFTMRDQFGK
jgi:phosphoglycerol transferase MdoB-like AlkP superfamily enzyme